MLSVEIFWSLVALFLSKILKYWDIADTRIKSIEAALKYNQNSAIFAPGWLVEKDRLEDSEEFWSAILKVNGSHQVQSENDESFKFSTENIVRDKSGQKLKVKPTRITDFS